MPYDQNPEPRRSSSDLRRNRAAAKAKKDRKRKLLIRRTIIVVVCALILFLAIFLFVQLIKLIFGIGKNNDAQKEDTQKIYSLASETTAPEGSTEPVSNSEAKNFVTPQIPDDQNSTGHLSEYDSSVYIYNNMALPLFNGTDASAGDYAKAVSEFKKSAPEYTVYNMVVPNHTEFALPRRLIDDNTVSTVVQANNIKKIYESYTEDVKPINCYNSLAEHLSEYIYFNTDSKWTGQGAYYAYQAFCAQTGQQALDLSTCTEKSISGFEGAYAGYDESLSSKLDTVNYWLFPYSTHATRMAQMGDEMQESSLYYESESSGSLAFGVFLSGDSPLFVAYNDTMTNGKKIAVVKDTNANAFVPFLTNNYKEVHVIDPSQWTGNLKSYMQDNGIDEVLFINTVENANSADYARTLRGIYSSSATTPTTADGANADGANADGAAGDNADAYSDDGADYEETPDYDYEETPEEDYGDQEENGENAE